MEKIYEPVREDIVEEIDKYMELQLQKAKLKGLTEVRSLLNTSLGDTSKKAHYRLVPTTKEGIDQILNGKINKLIKIPPHINLISREPQQSYNILVKRI